MKNKILEQLKLHGGGIIFTDLARNFVENNILILNELRSLIKQGLLIKSKKNTLLPTREFLN